MNTEWLKLRTFNGDRKTGFEELVCQLARVEPVENKVKFLRVAAPDGGVESYCQLSDNTEYGWQAKYFTSMGDAQWTQLDKSFKTAIDKHPNLVKYFICIPLDRQDPRITDEEWFMDKWMKKTEDWKSIALTKSRKVEFEYWGSSELFDRLSKPENEGKHYFWFGEEEFSDDWFKQKLEESILNLGKRYTPEINFDLPIAKVFEGISRDNFFQEQFTSHLDDLLRTFNKAISRVKEDKVKGFVDKIKSQITSFVHLLEIIDFHEISLINQESLSKILESCNETIHELIQQFYHLDSESKRNTKEKNDYLSHINRYAWEIENFRKLNGSIYDFNNFIGSYTVSLSNNPFLILTGEAGIGKSHLLADVAKKRLERNQFSILLLGQHFTTLEDPWSQIKKLLQLNCNKNTFLSTLNSKAESSESRILILIDAINEGEGKKIWKSHLLGFISSVKRFPYLGVVVSIRSSYEKLLVPEIIIEKNEAIKITHYGFANHEYEASKLFFENYQIKQPSIPLLHPEFSNPLFLKLFCTGLQKKGLHEIPDGYEGFSIIIDFFLESINYNISEKHNLPIHLNIVQKVIKQLAGEIAENGKHHMKYDDAFLFVTGLKELSSITEKSGFFQDLISEGLLTQNYYWGKGGSHYEGVYISYERFSDHLIAAHLIEKYLDKKIPKSSFTEDTKLVKWLKEFGIKFGIKCSRKKLFEYLKNEDQARYNTGVIEALSIQLPEVINLELYEVAVHAREFETVAISFVKSIIWRKKETLDGKLKDYINDVVIEKHGYHDFFLTTILLITSHPNNYFNSDFIHNHLMQFTMSERDAWWTQFIHNKYPGYSDDVSVIRRMIDWSWTDDSRDSISDESIRLLSQTMFWFLTSTNRTLRDSATKALICLLQERIKVLIELIKTFQNVNDPYVLQRLYAVAYGCAIRTSKVEHLKELGVCIFNSVFNTDYVVPDILLRDYARAIIEYSIYKNHKFEFNLENTQPPFKSELPSEYPTSDEINKYEFDYKDPNFKKHYWGQNSIIHSMITEYGRGTGGYGDFGRYVFQSALRNWKDANEDGLSNLAVKWIIEKYGYNVEMHGEFDRNLGSGRGRGNAMEERIGKKYQWIAFYEILARVSDNYTFYEDSYSRNSKPSKYEGPWNPYVRDIDPTVTIKGNPEDKSDRFWWNNVDYSNWDVQNKDWVIKTDDLPNPIDLINVTDLKGNEWLVLEMNPEWIEPTPLGEEKYDSPHKRLYYDLNSHLISKKDLLSIIKYLSNKNLRECDLSDSKNRYQMFSREYYWAAANRTFSAEYYNGNAWDELYDKDSGVYICNVARTAIQYFWEEEFDASKDGTIKFYKPTELLFNLLDLHYLRIEGQLSNKDNEVICFDPCTNNPTISCLLVRKLDLLKKLHENDLEIIWTCVGDKLILGGYHEREDYVGRLNISNFIYLDSGIFKYTSHFENE